MADGREVVKREVAEFAEPDIEQNS